MRRWIAILLPLLSALTAAQAQEQPGCDMNPRRIESARRLIEENKAFIAQAKELIAQAEQAAAESKQLQGQAAQYQSKIQYVNLKPLRGKDLVDAKKQFAADLQRYAEHLRKYQEHTVNVRQQYGACSQSNKRYERLRKQLTLHNSEFHVVPAPPPHICIDLGTSAQEAAAIQGQVQGAAESRSNAARELREVEKQLAASIAMSAATDAKVSREHQRLLREQELLAEFARLKEEHDQLQVGRNALKRSGVVQIPTVSGTVVRKK